MASSVSGLVQQLGGALGVASIALVHHWGFVAGLARGFDDVGADTFALHRAFAFAAIVVFLALLPAVFLPRRAFVRYASAHE
jgi:hypothetical protein